MTISSENRVSGPYNGNGVTTIFPFDFKIFSASDLYVVTAPIAGGPETILLLNTDYFATLNANQNTNPGGSINIPSPLSVSLKITITSNIDPLQITDLTNQGGFYPNVITDVFDRLTILIQQVISRSSRSLTIPLSSSGVSTELPSPQAGYVLGWNPLGSGIINYLVSSAFPTIFPMSVTDITTLRLTTPLYPNQIFNVLYHTSKGYGGGQFYYDSADTTSADDGGLIIVNGSYRFKRTGHNSYTPEMFGCTSTSTAVQATRAINKAYIAASAAGNGTVRYEQISYALDGNIDGTIDGSVLTPIRGGIQVKSRVITIFTGQIFTQTISSLTAYSLLNCSNASNFEIRGEATFIGDALTHVYVGPPGYDEFGHGLYLCNAHDFTISGLTFKTCWGDGVYVSDTNFTTLPLGIATMTTNGTINDCVFTQNRRQGCSGINGTGMVFNRCQFINTGSIVSTPPSSGVDLETDASITRNGMQDWAFNDCIMSGNAGPNVEIFPTLNNGKAGCEDIVFNNCKMTATGSQGSFFSDRGTNFVKNITVNGGVIEGGVYGGNATTFNNVKISRSMTDVSTAIYAIQHTTGTFGAHYNNCEIRAIGDTSINSKRLVFIDVSGSDINKPVFSKCKFVGESIYGGATNIVMITRSPCIFNTCEFSMEGTLPASYVGFDTTAGSSRVSPAFAMLNNCTFDANWHIGTPTLQGRVDIPVQRTRTTTAIGTNLIPTALAERFVINYTSGGVSNVGAPSDSFERRITIVIKNSSGGAIGAITWNAVYKMAGAFTNPANGFSRNVVFDYDLATTSWIEVTRNAADVPN